MTAAGLRDARANAAVRRRVAARRRSAEDRQLFVDFLAGAFGTGDLFAGRPDYGFKMIVAAAAIVFEYWHLSSLGGQDSECQITLH